MVLGKQEILFTFCHPLLSNTSSVAAGPGYTFHCKSPNSAAPDILHLQWALPLPRLGGRRSAELNFSPLSARWPALAVVTWFRKFLSLVCSVDGGRGGPYLTCTVWLHNWNKVDPLPPFFFLPMLTLQNILVRDIKSVEAQKPKTFWVATFWAQKVSGRGARYYF